jgi:ubiquinone/menaquinone biosynthesis C-methylase UbiE
MPSESAFSNALADNYDQYLGPLLFEPYAEDLANRIHSKGYKKVLELACGTGRLTRHLIGVLPPEAKLIATDRNAEMIKLASKLVAEEKIEWQIADAQQLAFPDGTFDLVVCQFGFMFMPDKMNAFSEVHRVLKNGGCLLFNTWDKIENNGAIYLGNQIICSYFPENPPSYYRVPFSLSQPDMLDTSLKATGFKTIQVTSVEKEGMSPSAKDAAIGIVQGNPIQAKIIEKDPALVNVILGAVEQKLAEVYGNRPMRSPLKAWVVEAFR